MNKPANSYIFSSGKFVNPPSIIFTGQNSLKCPVCGKTWIKKGSGYGFVKSSAASHVFTCFENELKRQGLKMKQPYNMDKLAWELETFSPK